MASSKPAQAGQFDDFFKAMAKRKLSVTDILKYSASDALAGAETSSTRVVPDEQGGRAKKRRKRRQVLGGSNDNSVVASRTGSQSAQSTVPQPAAAAVAPLSAQPSPAPSARPAVSNATKAAVKAERKRNKAVERARLRALERAKEYQQHAEGSPRPSQETERKDSDVERAQQLKQAKEAEEIREQDRQKRKAERAQVQQQQKEEAARLEQERQQWELARAQELKQAEDAAAAQEQEKRERKEWKAQRREARAQKKAEKAARKERKEVERLQQEAKAQEEQQRLEQERREREEEEERERLRIEEEERERLRIEEEARERRAAQERAFEEAKEKERAHFAGKARLKLEASNQREAARREEAKRKEAQREERKREKAERAQALEESRAADETARKAEEAAKEVKARARAERRKKRESTGTASTPKAKRKRAPSAAASVASGGEETEVPVPEPDAVRRATGGVAQNAHAENGNGATTSASTSEDSLPDNDRDERIRLIDEDKDFFMLDLPNPDWEQATHICQLPPILAPPASDEVSSDSVPIRASSTLEAANLASCSTSSVKQPAKKQARSSAVPSAKPILKTIEVVVPIRPSASSREDAVSRIPPSQSGQLELGSTIRAVPASGTNQARPTPRATPDALDDTSGTASTSYSSAVAASILDPVGMSPALIAHTAEDLSAQEAHTAEDALLPENGVRSEVLPSPGQSGSADPSFGRLAHAAQHSASLLTQHLNGEGKGVQAPRAGTPLTPSAVVLSDGAAEHARAEAMDLDEVDEVEDEDETERSVPAESEAAAVSVPALASSHGGAPRNGQLSADGQGDATSPAPGMAASLTNDTQPGTTADAPASKASSPASSESVAESGGVHAAGKPFTAPAPEDKTSTTTEMQFPIVATDHGDSHVSARDQVVVDTPTNSTFDMDMDADPPAAPEHPPSPPAPTLSPAQVSVPGPSSPTSSQPVRVKPSVGQLLDSLEDEDSSSSSDGEEEDDGYLEDQSVPNISISQRRRYAASSSPEIDGASEAGSIQNERHSPAASAPASTGMFAPILHAAHSAADSEERDASPPAVISSPTFGPAEVKESPVVPQQDDPSLRETEAQAADVPELPEASPSRAIAQEDGDAVHARQSPATSGQRSESPQASQALRSPDLAVEGDSLPVAVPPSIAADVETSKGAVGGPSIDSTASASDGNTEKPQSEDQQAVPELEIPSSEAKLDRATVQPAPAEASASAVSLPEQTDLRDGDSDSDDGESAAGPLQIALGAHSPESPIYLPTPSKPVSQVSGSSMLESIRQRRKSLSIQDESASQISQDLLNDMRGSPIAANGTVSPPTAIQPLELRVQPPSTQKTTQQRVMSPPPSPRRSPRLASASPGIYPSLAELRDESPGLASSQTLPAAVGNGLPSTRPTMTEIDLQETPPSIITGFDTKSQIDALDSQPSMPDDPPPFSPALSANVSGSESLEVEQALVKKALFKASSLHDRSDDSSSASDDERAASGSSDSEVGKHENDQSSSGSLMNRGRGQALHPDSNLRGLPRTTLSARLSGGATARPFFFMGASNKATTSTPTGAKTGAIASGSAPPKLNRFGSLTQQHAERGARRRQSTFSSLASQASQSQHNRANGQQADSSSESDGDDSEEDGPPPPVSGIPVGRLAGAAALPTRSSPRKKSGLAVFGR